MQENPNKLHFSGLKFCKYHWNPIYNDWMTSVCDLQWLNDLCVWSTMTEWPLYVDVTSTAFITFMFVFIYTAYFSAEKNLGF